MIVVLHLVSNLEYPSRASEFTPGFCGVSSLAFSVIFCERQPQLLLNYCSLGAVTSGLLRTRRVALFMHEALTYVYLLGIKQVDGVSFGWAVACSGESRSYLYTPEFPWEFFSYFLTRTIFYMKG